jgi:hypothetical protein
MNREARSPSTFLKRQLCPALATMAQFGCLESSFARLRVRHDRRYDPALHLSSHRGQENHNFERRGDAAVDGGAAPAGWQIVWRAAFPPGAIHRALPV